MNSRDAILKQINSLEGLEALYHSEGKYNVAASFRRQAMELNGELLRISIIEGLSKRNKQRGLDG